MGLFDPPPLTANRPADSDLGPLPPRSRDGLLWQFWLQWVYLTVFAVLILAIIGLLLWISAAGNGDVPTGGVGGGGGGELSYGGGVVLTRERYRIERSGTPTQWAARAEELLRKGIGVAEERHAKAVAKATAKGKPAPAPSVRTIKLTAGAYRGVGAGAVEEIAERLGWQVDWKRTNQEKLLSVYVVRRSEG